VNVTISIAQLLVALAALGVALAAGYLSLRTFIDRVRKERFEEGFKQGQESTKNTSLLLPGEQHPSPKDQEQKSLDLIRSAKRSIEMLVVDGGRWLPRLASALNDACARGVDVKLLMLDPACEVNKYLCDVERELTPNADFNQWPPDASEQAAQIVKNRSKLEGAVKVRYYSSYPIWRGVIIDDAVAMYRIVHIPVYGWVSPERRCDNPLIVRHFHTHNFLPLWQRSR
jgi:hypothetical protein